MNQNNTENGMTKLTKEERAFLKEQLDMEARRRTERREGTALKYCKECEGQLPCRTIDCRTCRDRNAPVRKT